MRVVARIAFAALLAVAAVMAADGNVGSLSCPTSSGATNIGCYCTSGCSINGDTVFPWNSPVFPPPVFPAAAMGNDTICARITIPTLSVAAAVNLSAYLGVTGQISTTGGLAYNGVVTNSQVTIWTAFTTSECNAFVARARNVVAANSEVSKLYVNLCATDLCNKVNLPERPTTAVAVANSPSQLPGNCPLSNQQNTACYCTNGCSINGDTTGFPWKANSWPPIGYTASFVGNDTICARITIPVINSVSGRALAAYLGVTGDINRTGSSNYFGAASGQTVTIYTAFTAAECANYIATARGLTDTFNSPLGVLLCNTSNCNSIPETNIGGGISGSSASPLSMMIAAVVSAVVVAISVL